ncbi:hypothetical protein DPMN_105170 [Dreissena polymorpha]|uniref:Uncharacterized protein n=1 Tax=Dreissena polymorpha TaxID=45954 RepID=A0A9D4HDC6_DREPO|nr:hypothetical protein DPMN_105170 [Dreissena polymorpha]
MLILHVFTRNVASRVFTRNTAPPTGGHVFQLTGTTFELNQHITKTNILTKFELDLGIIGTNLLSKFHEDRKRNVASRVFTRKTAPPTGGHIGHKIFELNRGIIGKNLLTKFHEDRKRNVASRVFTRETAPPTGGHVFQRTRTTFELYQHIIKTNILKNFKLDRGIIGTNLLTKFHEDRTRNVASRVFTNQMWMMDGQMTSKNDHKSSPEQSVLRKQDCDSSDKRCNGFCPVPGRVWNRCLTELYSWHH